MQNLIAFFVKMNHNLGLVFAVLGPGPLIKSGARFSIWIEDKCTLINLLGS